VPVADSGSMYGGWFSAKKEGGKKEHYHSFLGERAIHPKINVTVN